MCYQATVKLAERDVEVKKRVGRMRDMAKVKFSRQWIERRSRWLRGHAMASKTNDAFKATLANKQNNAEARLHDRNLRVAKLIEVKKEFKALRRLMKGEAGFFFSTGFGQLLDSKAMPGMAERREVRRREQRRKAELMFISEELLVRLKRCQDVVQRLTAFADEALIRRRCVFHSLWPSML
ncbi:gpt [Symbiodinium sp. CCMP2592]|nr:gpt [Symbiodinium sp. CCMP2592]